MNDISEFGGPKGSLYQLTHRRLADLFARIAFTLIAIVAILVFLSPLDLAQVETYRLSGEVLGWQEATLMTPRFSLDSPIFLAGAALSVALVGLLRIVAGSRRRVRGPARFGFLGATAAALLTLAVVASPVLADSPATESGAAATAAADDSPAAASATTDDPAASEESEEPQASFFAETTVTATGTERDVFEVATPVTVIRRSEIERLAPDSAVDLLRDQPGVDVNGVGPNQLRPVIRGQRGLRVLFLADGLRLNNARRQSDFGEIGGLVDAASLESVEVVRGPASVLYGSDAIGGALNLITRKPSFASDRNLTGSFQAGAASAGDTFAGNLSFAGRGSVFDYQLGYSQRSAGDYDAPSGTFGDITLAEDTRVMDTGVDDKSLWGSFGWNLNDRNSFELRAQNYRADDAGFGFVEPEAIGTDEAFRIRILYPYQKFERYTLTYFGTALESSFADSLQAKLYQQSNRRSLVNDIDIDIGPIFPGAPSSSVTADTENWTDLDTWGLREETIKAIGTKHLLTYGGEVYSDDSVNTDYSETTTTFRFPFPPSVMGIIPGFTCVDFTHPFECSFTSTDDKANAPNATNSSWGVFAQDEWSPMDRLRISAGLRYQQVTTKAEPTPQWDITGLDFDDDAVVGSLTATWQIIPELNLLASYGTAFRAPSIVERLFNGLTPEGSGFQILNPDLKSENSDNIDLGIKYRRRDAFMELVAFRTVVDDGIIQYFLSDEEIAGLPQDVQDEIEASHVDFVVQQQNAEQLRYQGLELALGYRFENGITVGGNYTHLDADRLDSTNPPTGDTYGDKGVAFVRWQPETHRFWVEYRFRYNGSVEANLDPNEPVPAVGTELPSFALHNIGAGVTLFEHGRFSHELQVAVENLTDELYAEFSNATFFRPESGMNIRGSYRLRF